MTCKACGLDHPGHIMCKRWAAMEAARKAQVDALLATIKPAAEIVKPLPEPVKPSVKPVAEVVKPVTVVNPDVKPRHLNDDRKAYMREYMRAYMAKRRTA